MKAKGLIFAVLLAVLLLPCAAANLNVTVGTLQATHNTANSGTFTLQNLNTSLSVSSINCTVTVGSLTTSAGCPTTLAANGSQTVAYSVTVPQYTVAGTYPGSVLAQGMINGTIYNSTTQAFSVNVTNSPTLTITWITSPQDVYQGQNTSAIINVSNTGNVGFSSVSINVTNVTGVNAIYSAASIPLITGSSGLWNISISTDDDTYYGTNTITLAAKGSDATSLLNATATSSSSFEVLYRYCGTNSSTSRIVIDEISNEDDISGEEFDPLDVLNVDVEVKNNYDEERTAIVTAVLVYEDSVLDETEVEENVDINDDDTETVTLSITIPVDADEGAYSLYVKAYDDDSSKYCDQEVINFIVERSSSHKMVSYDVEATPANVSCGSLVQINGKLGNIGSLDEDKVKLVYNDGWSEQTKTYEDFDDGEDADFEFVSTVPKNATEGAHSFTLNIYYNYDEDDDAYDKSVGQTHNLFSISAGSCAKDTSDVSISSETASTQIFAGSQSEVRILVSNSGTVKQTYTVEVPTVSWAAIGSISPASFELESGAARYVSIKLTPNATVTGSQSMDVKVNYGGTSQTKTLSLNVQKVSDVSNLIDRVKFSVSRDWAWYLIGGIIALIIVLIFAISASSKKAGMIENAVKNNKIKQYKNY